MAEHPPTGETYGHLTGRKRLTLMLLGAVSGLAVAIMFAFFAQRAVPTIELIVGTAIGALLGLSASLGERRRKRARPD